MINGKLDGVGMISTERLHHVVKLGAIKLFKDGTWAFVTHLNHSDKWVLRYLPMSVMKYLRGEISKLHRIIGSPKVETKVKSQYDFVADEFAGM